MTEDGVPSLRDLLARAVEGSFPSLGRIIDSAREAHDKAEHGPTAILVNPAHLARFESRHIARDGCEARDSIRLSLQSDPHKPVLVTFSDHFEGVLMTRRDIG